MPICMIKLGFTHIYHETSTQNKYSLTRPIRRYIGHRLRRKPIIKNGKHSPFAALVYTPQAYIATRSFAQRHSIVLSPTHGTSAVPVCTSVYSTAVYSNRALAAHSRTYTTRVATNIYIHITLILLLNGWVVGWLDIRSTACRVSMKLITYCLELE